MILPEMLADLPRTCDVGVKRDAKGHQESWSGCKLHIDAADGGVPLSCILTSASLHDSQVAIPLATLTAARVTNLANPRSASRKLERKTAARAQRTVGHVYAEQSRYRERTTVERVKGRLKDEFGARQVRLRGHAKVLCHLMFGIVALAVSQLMRLLN